MQHWKCCGVQLPVSGPHKCAKSWSQEPKGRCFTWPRQRLGSTNLATSDLLSLTFARSSFVQHTGACRHFVKQKHVTAFQITGPMRSLTRSLRYLFLLVQPEGFLNVGVREHTHAKKMIGATNPNACRHGGARSCLLSGHPFSTFCRDMPLRSFQDRLSESTFASPQDSLEQT